MKTCGTNLPNCLKNKLHSNNLQNPKILDFNSRERLS